MDQDPSYQELYDTSIHKPQEFWADAAQAISWSKPWDKVLEKARQMALK